MKKWMATLVVGACLTILLPAKPMAGPFQMWVSVSPPGPDNNNPATWSGILRYRFDGVGGPATVLPAIDRSLVADPCGLAFRVGDAELLVGNRHGNTGDGSISRFRYDDATDSFTPNGTITGNGLNGVHQLALNPVTGELYATNYGGGVSRFTFAGDVAAPNGMLGGSQWTRGVAVSPNGALLFVTSATNVIRRFRLATGEELPGVTVTGAVSLHFLRLSGANQLFVGDPTTSMVYGFHVDVSGALSDQVDIPAPSAVGEAFSPDGREMFATGHLTSHQITRLVWNPVTQAWVAGTPIYPEVPMGDILALSEAAMVGVPNAGPAVATLLPNHPNPFNPLTVIPFRLESPALVELIIHDAAGRTVRTLASGAMAAGPHEARWDGTDRAGRAVGSGVYFVRMKTGAMEQVRPLVLVR